MLSKGIYRHQLINPIDPFFDRLGRPEKAANRELEEHVRKEREFVELTEEREFAEFAAKELKGMKDHVKKEMQEMRDVMAKEISEALFRFSRLVRLLRF